MAESQSTRDMRGWLAEANAAGFAPSRDFGSPSGDSEQENPSSAPISGATRGTDGSIDSDS